MAFDGPIDETETAFAPAVHDAATPTSTSTAAKSKEATMNDRMQGAHFLAVFDGQCTDTRLERVKPLLRAWRILPPNLAVLESQKIVPVALVRDLLCRDKPGLVEVYNMTPHPALGAVRWWDMPV